MRILLCHNYYQQPGGEDRHFEDEIHFLRAHGHEVVTLVAHNDTIPGRARLGLVRDALWNARMAQALRDTVRRCRAQVVHFHNTFPLISPAGYYAARDAGAVVVQTLHNFRLLCVNALLYRDRRLCEQCLRRMVPWRGVLHGCYRQSRNVSAVVAAMITLHRSLGTWRRAVDRYIAVSEFARRKFIEGGLPAQRINVIPNAVHPDPGPGGGSGGYAVFVGRLTQEKGVATLLSAWERLSGRLKLKIIGDGPLAGEVETAARRTPGVEWLGYRTPPELLAIVGEAACLVMPSVWYETFGRTIIEAFAKGTPVIASRLGAMAELVDDGRTGLFFEPGNARDLVVKAARLLDDPAMLNRMRREARREYEEKYTAERNYRMLMEVYHQAGPADVQAPQCNNYDPVAESFQCR